MKRIPESIWTEIRTAYASGIGLREMARNMDIPEGTVLARAKRERWSRHRDNAKALAKRQAQSSTALMMSKSSTRSLGVLSVFLMMARMAKMS